MIPVLILMLQFAGLTIWRESRNLQCHPRCWCIASWPPAQRPHEQLAVVFKTYGAQHSR